MTHNIPLFIVFIIACFFAVEFVIDTARDMTDFDGDDE